MTLRPVRRAACRCTTPAATSDQPRARRRTSRGVARTRLTRAPHSGRPSMCARRLDAEQPQRRRRDVDRATGSSCVDRAGCRRTRRARAADRCSDRRSTACGCPRTPGPATTPRRAVPRRAIAGVVADDEVGRVLEIGPAVERRGVERLVDADRRPSRRRAGRAACAAISCLERDGLGARARRCPAPRGPSRFRNMPGEARARRRASRDQSTSRSHSARPSAPGLSAR